MAGKIRKKPDDEGNDDEDDDDDIVVIFYALSLDIREWQGTSYLSCARYGSTL
jgi:hypothetical protein